VGGVKDEFPSNQKQSYVSPSTVVTTFGVSHLFLSKPPHVVGTSSHTPTPFDTTHTQLKGGPAVVLALHWDEFTI
jgi:hypothetical protein